MKIALIALLSTCVLSFIGSIVVAAPGQSQRPGDISPPNVWVQNRSPNEAIPVTIVDAGQPLRFQFVGATPEGILLTRAARQAWEYSQVRLAANQDVTALLNTAGADGWETTGTQLSTAGATVIVLKRPR